MTISPADLRSAPPLAEDQPPAPATAGTADNDAILAAALRAAGASDVGAVPAGGRPDPAAQAARDQPTAGQAAGQPADPQRKTTSGAASDGLQPPGATPEPPATPPKPPPVDHISDTPYDEMRDWRTGAPLFSKSELRILSKRAKDCSKKQRSIRKTLQNRATAWRRQAKDRRERDQQRARAEGLDNARQDAERQHAAALTGREPWEALNVGLTLAGTARLMDPAAAELCKITDAELRELAPVTLELAQAHPWIADLLQLKWIGVEVRFCVVVGSVVVGKLAILAAWAEAQEAAAKSEAARTVPARVVDPKP